MPSAPLYDAAAQEIRYAGFMIQTINEAGPDVADAALYNELCGHYRNVAVSFLLLDGDLDAFAHGLIDSALTRRQLLRRGVPEEPDHAFRASFLDPFHDAVAVGQLGLAAEIARRSPDTWYPDFEYEEDFLYAQLLFGLLDRGTQDLSALADRHDDALRGVDDPRGAVCRALIGRDPVAFVEAFEEFVRTKVAETAEARETSYAFYEYQEVSVEGLALLRLAERAGLPTEREYRHCPSWGRRTDYAPYVPESFPNVPIDG